MTNEQDTSAETDPDEGTPGDIASPGLEPLRSVHTTNLPELLRQIQSTVMVTTYQAGKLVLLRNDEGVLNTHFRPFPKPMGLAVTGGRLAVGTNASVVEYHNTPAVAPKIEPEGRHDAAWLPRRENVTGNVQIHEMAWIDGENGAIPELWFVNTAFSCLCLRSDEFSFEPRWRPKFVSQLAPGDRCHLNGLAVRDGRVKYVTALGETDEPGAWRANKRDGGILIDVESSEIITRGLSMPHSPRWYNDRLWILNSGTGGFGTIELDTGTYHEITQLPGFTRGLCFAGPLAFIGLSQVRESAVFSGIPLVERLKENEERSCGVWVVNIQTGETIAFVKFEDALQEIFAVELLAGQVFPDLIQNGEFVETSYVLPDESLKDVPEELRK